MGEELHSKGLADALQGATTSARKVSENDWKGFGIDAPNSGLKWISATRGTSQPALRTPSRMCSRFSAYFLVWAVMRTISQPASANSRTSFTQAWVSRVSAVIMDWILIGFRPPTPTPPTMTSRVHLRSKRKRSEQ